LEGEPVKVHAMLRERDDAPVLIGVGATSRSTGSRVVAALLMVLLVDAISTALRGLDFVRYAFTESRVAIVAVILWLGLSALSLLLFRRLQDWAAAAFARYRSAVATVVYAYLLLAVSLGLTLEHLAELLGVDWLKTGETNRIASSPQSG
jgi:hypothetical protein